MSDFTMSDAEAEELLRTDETPDVGYKKSAADRKAAAAYMRAWRADKKDQQDREESKPRRSDLSALFEFDGRLAVTSDQMLNSCLIFASHLDQENPRPGETLIEFGNRVFDAWREANFPLLFDSRELIQLPDYTGSLPILWPPGAELEVNQDRVYWVEKMERDSEKIQDHWRNRNTEWGWRWNPTTKFYEPIQDFKRPEPRDELADARLGYRWEVQKEFSHPLLVRHEGLADSSFRMRKEDLVQIMQADFERCQEELGRKQ
jgi:hypothetical protein